MLGLFHRRWSFRVEPEAELQGLNVAEHGASTELLELLTNMDRHRAKGDFAQAGAGRAAHRSRPDRRRIQPRDRTGSTTKSRAREEAVEAARTAEEKYRGIFENAVEGMFQTTPDGRYLERNPALATIYGYDSADELMRVARPTSARCSTSIRSRRDDFRTLVERDGMVVNFESEVRRRDGATIWISENARAIRDADGSVICYEGTVVDVTARREATAMQAQMEAAEAANRAKSEFLANMSHEIRTPLNGVMGMLELLGTTSLDDRQQRFVHLARSSADALLALINQILDFSKIEAGKLELEHVEFRLHPLVEDLAEVLGHRAHKKGIELACRIHGDVPDVVGGDPERLRQVLVNLMNNAVKFTETGRVEIDVAYDDDGDWRPRVRFEVRDTGIGVPGESPRSAVPAVLASRCLDDAQVRRHRPRPLDLQATRRSDGRRDRLRRADRRRLDLPLRAAAGSSPAVRRRRSNGACRSGCEPAGLGGRRRRRQSRIARRTPAQLGRDARHGRRRDDGAGDGSPRRRGGHAVRLVVLDRKLPDMDGLDLAVQHSRRRRRTPTRRCCCSRR